MSMIPHQDEDGDSYTETPLSSGAQRAFEDIQMSAAPITDALDRDTADILTEAIKEATKIRDGKDADRQNIKRLKLSGAPIASSKSV